MMKVRGTIQDHRNDFNFATRNKNLPIGFYLTVDGVFTLGILLFVIMLLLLTVTLDDVEAELDQIHESP